jgi:hypothetical protein
MEILLLTESYLSHLFDALESRFPIEIEDDIVDQIMKDIESFEEKTYQITKRKSKIKIVGFVDEYEPDTIFLEFSNLSKRKAGQIQNLVENYEFAFGTGTDFIRSEEESLAIFKKGI